MRPIPEKGRHTNAGAENSRSPDAPNRPGILSIAPKPQPVREYSYAHPEPART
ncbi:hypothetical protein [Microcoleus sp. LEGE 07076]|uniref:hypothetical protein n=1 Tax=Microcoleus sp. LEGE 07076 TaxID=915322 RepID=UPI001D1341FA|nr:hypothetical protein [Microcoleus sp. LEGE 07076]